MENSTLSSVVDRGCAGVISEIAPAGSPVVDIARRGMSGRLRTAPVMAPRSQGGVGSYRVVDPQRGMWRLDPQINDQDPKFFTHKFSTRQGPPTCSPPV